MNWTQAIENDTCFSKIKYKDSAKFLIFKAHLSERLFERRMKISSIININSIEWIMGSKTLKTWTATEQTTIEDHRIRHLADSWMLLVNTALALHSFRPVSLHLYPQQSDMPREAQSIPGERFLRNSTRCSRSICVWSGCDAAISLYSVWNILKKGRWNRRHRLTNRGLSRNKIDHSGMMTSPRLHLCS